MADNIHINLLEEPNMKKIGGEQLDFNINTHSNDSNEEALQGIGPSLDLNSQKETAKNVMLKDKLIEGRREGFNDSVISNPFLNSNQELNGDKMIGGNSVDIGLAKPENAVNTLNEPIIETIKRDCCRIGRKLYYVLNPFSTEENRPKEIIHWDLWGPLLFTIVLSFTLAFESINMGQIFILVFFLIWGGSFVVYLNSNLLGSPLNLFNTICLLGYCLVPLNIMSLIFALTHFNEIFRVILILFACSWSSYSAIGFMRNSTTEDKQILLLYPVILLYLFISGVILMR